MTTERSEIGIKALGLLILSGCLVGLGPVIAKSIAAPAVAIVLYRLALPIPILYIIHKMQNAGATISQKRSTRDKILMSLIGIFFALDLAAFYISLRYTSVTSATLLSNLSPIFIATYAIIKNRRMTKEIIWLCLSIIGLVLLCGVKENYAAGEVFGYASATAAAVFFSGYILLINKLGKSYSSAEIMLWSSIGGAICVLLICLLFKVNIQITAVNSIIYILLLAFGVQLIGQSLLTKAISIFPPAFSSLGILIDPVAAAFFSWLILSEPLSLTEMIGAVLILSGILGSYRCQKNESNESHETIETKIEEVSYAKG